MKKSVVALIVVLLAGALWLQQQPKDTAQTLPALPTFALANVQHVEVMLDHKTTLKAQRDGDAWILADADSRQLLHVLAIEQLLMDLQNMQPKRVVSHNPENAAKFEVAASDARVTLTDANKKVLLDVFVGKPATDLRSTYIRLASEDKVLTVDKTLTWQVKRTPESWFATPAAEGV